MIITFASSKGGAGKSTTCACIAAELAREGANVVVNGRTAADGV